MKELNQFEISMMLKLINESDVFGVTISNEKTKKIETMNDSNMLNIVEEVNKGEDFYIVNFFGDKKCKYEEYYECTSYLFNKRKLSQIMYNEENSNEKVCSLFFLCLEEIEDNNSFYVGMYKKDKFADELVNFLIKNNK